MANEFGDLSRVGDLSAKPSSSIQVTWKISNFLELPKTVDYSIDSPEFQFANATWYLILFTNGSRRTKSAGFIDIFLQRSQIIIEEQHCFNVKLSLKNNRGKESNCSFYECTIDNNSRGCGLSCLFRRSYLLSQREFLVPDKTLTVICRIRLEKVEKDFLGAIKDLYGVQQRLNEAARSRMKAASSQTEVPPELLTQTKLKEASPQTEVPKSATRIKLQVASSQTEVPATVTQTDFQDASSQTEVPESVALTEVEEASSSVQKLQLDYHKLLISEEDSDVCLKVSNKEFRAHRCILRARSKVFSAMFKHETEEKTSGEVVIDDLDPESFSDFLQHVYAGRVEGLSDKNVFNLYYAADKYDLQELKSGCREYMKRNLSVANFCDFLVVSLRHKEEELLQMAIEFFAVNYAEIFFTVNWQRFLTDHPTEANELLIKGLVPGKKN